MRISELTYKLDLLMGQNGDIEVEVRNIAGEFDVMTEIDVRKYRPPEGPYTWLVYLDT